MSETLPQALSLEETVAFLESAFPQMEAGGRTYHLVEVGPGLARLRMDHHDRHLRPGGTISGPTMMALSDLALYAAKRGGRNRVATTSPSLQTEMVG